MTPDELKTLLAQPVVLLALMYLAALTSALQQISASRKAGGEVYSLAGYLKYWPETGAVVIGNLIAFVLLVPTDQLTLVAALGIGYGSNFAADALRGGGRSAAMTPTPAAPGQGGYAHPTFIAILLAISTIAAVGLPGCTSTRDAYATADSPGEYAYVISEHYAALVHEAADLAELPSTPADVVEAMQRADKAAQPAIARLAEASTAWQAIDNATTEAELQAAIDNAVRLVAELLRTVQTARGAGK